MTRWRLIKALLAVSTLAIVGLGVAAAVAASRDSGSSSSDHVRPQDDGSPATAWLGILGDTSDDPAGVRIVQVFDGSAADDAGLDRNDVITAIDGDDTASIEDLRDTIQAHAPGDEVTLSVIKDGEDGASNIDVTLGEQPERDLLDIQLPNGFGGSILDSLHDLFPDGFDSFLDGSFRYKDDSGDTHEVSAVAGTVIDISDDSLTIDTNDGDSQSFDLTDDAHVPDGIEPGDDVIVVSIDGDVTAIIAPRRIFENIPFRDFHFDLDRPGLCDDTEPPAEDLPSEGDWVPGDFCTNFRGIQFDLDPMKLFCEDGQFPFPPLGLFDEERVREEYCQDSGD